MKEAEPTPHSPNAFSHFSPSKDKGKCEWKVNVRVGREEVFLNYS